MDFFSDILLAKYPEKQAVLKSTKLKIYLEKRIDDCVAKLKEGKIITCSNVCFNIVSADLIKPKNHDELSSLAAQYFEKCRTPLNSFLIMPNDLKAIYPKFGKSENNPIVDEVYSTYYGCLASSLLGSPIKPNEMWFKKITQKGGLIYSREYSDTEEYRRMESEMLFQTYLGILLAQYTGYKLNLDSTKEILTRFILQARTTTALYYAIISQIKLGVDAKIYKSRVEDHLKKHLTADGLVYDYLLSIKSDEDMGSKSLTSLDKISPHLFSTYYALKMNSILDLNLKLADTPYILQKFENEDGGYGAGISFKQFSKTVQNSTLFESLIACTLISSEK